MFQEVYVQRLKVYYQTKHYQQGELFFYLQKFRVIDNAPIYIYKIFSFTFFQIRDF